MILKKLKTIGRFLIVALLVVGCLCSSIYVFFSNVKSLPLVYGKTYYATLPNLYRKLEKAEGKKIVIIGNSSVAFGVDSALLQELLNGEGYDYTVCNFGLYGSIGTLTMLELSKTHVKEGDIVLYMPEAVEQSQSLYFSATELWYSLENEEDMDLIDQLDDDLRTQMLTNYISFQAKRKAQKEEADGSGIYTSVSFDENCDLKNYDRPLNEMEEGADYNNLVDLDLVQPTQAYFDFVNGYYHAITEQNAKMYYYTCPINRSALRGDQARYQSMIDENYDFSTLGRFDDSVMDEEWFYDSNFHLNETGMEVFTVTLFNALKTKFGCTTVTEYTMPEKPNKNPVQEIIVGDDTDEACFLYEEYKEGYRICGLTDEAKERTELILPVSHEGKAVLAITSTALAGATSLRKLTVQTNIRSLPDYLFSDCKRFDELVLQHKTPQSISVGYHLLSGANSKAKIYVPSEAKSAFINNYFWSNYAEVICAYE